MNASPPKGEVRLIRHNDGRLEVEYADAVVWFAHHTLELLKADPDPAPGWAFDGSFITLDVDNGRWVWRLTGRTWVHEYSPSAEPLVMLEAIWPD